MSTRVLIVDQRQPTRPKRRVFFFVLVHIFIQATTAGKHSHQALCVCVRCSLATLEHLLSLVIIVMIFKCRSLNTNTTHVDTFNRRSNVRSSTHTRARCFSNHLARSWFTFSKSARVRTHLSAKLTRNSRSISVARLMFTFDAPYRRVHIFL